VVVNDEGLRGCNTDATAFVKTLSEKTGALGGLNCAVIGAGGAARSVLWGLRQEGAHATVFARDLMRARPVAEKFDAHLAPLAEARFAGYDVVINTTPLGTRGPSEEETPAVASQLHGARIVYDLVYNPLETRLLREAGQAGCETMGGLPMLVAQAAEQFYYWTGREAPFELMQRAAQAALGASYANERTL
jgi:shikimate dehydrogenase